MARPLDRMAAQSFPAAVGGLGAILVAFAFADLALYPEAQRWPVFVLDLALAVAFLFLAWRTRDGTLQPHLAHPLMSLAVALTVGNIGLGIALGVEPAESIYLVLAVVGTGSVFLSWRWTLAVCAFSYGAWLALSWSAPLDWAKVQYGLGLFGACAVAMLVVGVRAHTHANLDRLRQQERGLRERLQAVVTGAPIVLFALDAEGRIRFATGKGLESAGVRAEALLGRSIHEVWPAPEELSSHLTRALAGEASTSVLHARDASFLVSWGPAHGADGRVSGVVGVATNITEQARAQRELEETRRHAARQERLAALGTLVAGVAHEINNPLAYMKGNTQVTRGLLDALEREAGLSPQARADVRTLLGLQASTLQGIERLSHISEGLRGVARSGGRPREPLDLARVAAGALAVAAPRLPPGIVVETDLAPVAPVLGDETELSQVALNLLLNAADELAQRGGGVVRVRACEAEDGVALEVEDDGQGIAPDRQHLVFAPFFTTKPHGTGLGLSISHRIVDDHGGRLTFTSRPGRTVFRVALPRAGAEAATPPPARAA